MTHRIILAAVLGTLVLAAFAVSALFGAEPSLSTPLLTTDVEDMIPRNAVFVEHGTVVEGELRRDLDAAQPYILRGTVIIPPDAVVTVRAGVAIFAERDARLVVRGTLNAERSSWSSNLRHPSRQYWHGILGEDGSVVNLRDVHLEHASTGVTCSRGAQLTIQHSTFVNNVAAVATLPGSTCVIQDTRLESGRVGVQVLGGSPAVTRVTFDRLHSGIRVFHEGTPRLAQLSFSHLSSSALAYAAEPALTIQGLTLSPPGDPYHLILDGSDVPTHRFQEQEYPTGLVTLLP